MGIKKLYQDKDWLYNQFAILDKSCIQIANSLGYKKETIRKWKRIHNLQKFHNNKELLFDLYINKEKTLMEIGNMFNRAPETIRNLLRKFKIPLRNRGWRIGKHNPSWKGGRRKSTQGYIIVIVYNHPNSYKNEVFEHVIVMEKCLERYITREECIHHINCIKDDNRIENLYLCKNISEHKIIHNQMELLLSEILQLGLPCSIDFSKESGKYFIKDIIFD